MKVPVKKVARKRISNELIAIMIVVLVVVSIMGFLPLLKGPQLTGAQVAETWLELTQEVGCNFDDGSINFSTMKKDVTRARNTNWSDQVGDWWIINNTGTIDLSINISVSGGNWLFTSQAAASPYWQYMCNESDSGTCTVASFANVPSTATTLMLSNLSETAGSDTSIFAVNASVPNEESAGAKNGTVIASCWSETGT